MSKAIVWKSLVNASATFVYTTVVAWFLFNAETIFGRGINFLVPLFMLIIFIVSATVTGLFVLGKPAQLYSENRKKEAVIMLFTTLAWLLFFCSFIILALVIK